MLEAGSSLKVMAMSDKEIKICSVCQHENSGDRVECAKCGSPLESYNTTIQVPDKPATQEPEIPRVIRRSATPSDAITLFVLGHSQPLVVNGQERLILGRVAAAGPVPTVDLSRYNAHMLGVSRNHAAITRTDTGYALEDLGSTNGTWLNENRLLPGKPAALQNGDLFRLGQLMMVAYFTPTAVPTERTIFLKDRLTTSGQAGLSPQYLLTIVTPYLETIAELQHLIDEMRGLDSHEVGINSLDLASGTLKVTMRGATEAIQLLERKVLPWRTQFVAQLGGIGEIQPQPELVETRQIDSSTGGMLARQPAARTTLLDPERLASAQTQDFQRKMAGVIFQELGADLSEEQRAMHEARLVALLSRLLVSTLEISSKED